MSPAARMSAIRATLDAMYFTGTHLVSRPIIGGMGAVLMFHRIRPLRDEAFQPNRFLEITPDFLEETIVSVRDRGIEIVSMDEACRRIEDGRSDGRFVVLSFDDAYRDNLEFGWPVLQKHDAPWTLFVTSDFADGVGKLWWQALEETIRDNDRLSLRLGGRDLDLSCSDTEEKADAYHAVLSVLDLVPGATRAMMEQFEERGLDADAHCKAECLNWDELRELDRSALLTVGAHTVSHPILAHLTPQEVRHELSHSRQRIAEEMGASPVHLAYPHGGPNACGAREFTIATELGYASAVTTRPGVLYRDHGAHMRALPRLTVNGLFQDMRYLDVLLSGAPSMLKNRFRRIAA